MTGEMKAQIEAAQKILDETHPAMFGTGKRIAALEADLTQAVQMYTDAAGERDRALAELAKVKAENVWFAEQLKTAEAERDAEMAKEREVVIDIINAYSTVCDRSADMLQAIRARSKP